MGEKKRAFRNTRILGLSLVQNWVIGPLLEVPVLIGLVNVAFYLQRRYFGPPQRDVVGATHAESVGNA